MALRIEAPKSATEIETEMRGFVNDDELGEFIGKVEAARPARANFAAGRATTSRFSGRPKPSSTTSNGHWKNAEAQGARQVRDGLRPQFLLPAHRGHRRGEALLLAVHRAQGRRARMFPENVDLGISWTPPREDEPVAMLVSPQMRDKLKARLDEAVAKGDETIQIPASKSQSKLGMRAPF